MAKVRQPQRPPQPPQPLAFEYRKGHPAPPVPAQVLGEELERHRARTGEIIPTKVVRAAKNPNNPIHDCFPWDDRKAADAHRLEVAKRLIRSVEIVQHPRDPAAQPIRHIAYVSIGRRFTGGTSAYVSLTDAMTDPNKRSRVLADAQAQLRGWRRRFGDLEEYAEVVAAIDGLEDKDE